MSAADVLSMTQAERVVLILEGERLTWQADHQPPAALLAEIKARRMEIIEVLSAVNNCTASIADLEGSEPTRYTLSAATASPEWRQARDRYINHLMPCRDCHAPTDRYCDAGADLRRRYDLTPMG